MPKPTPLTTLKLALQFATFQDANIMNTANALINELENTLVKSGYDFDELGGTELESIQVELNDLIIDTLRTPPADEIEPDDAPKVGNTSGGTD